MRSSKTFTDVVEGHTMFIELRHSSTNDHGIVYVQFLQRATSIYIMAVPEEQLQ